MSLKLLIFIPRRNSNTLHKLRYNRRLVLDKERFISSRLFPKALFFSRPFPTRRLWHKISEKSYHATVPLTVSMHIT